MLAFGADIGCDNDGGYDAIYRVNADGSGLTTINDQPGRHGSPAWSPDNTRIAFVAFLKVRGSASTLADTDGANLARVDTPGIIPNYEVAWSPDASRIAFVGRDLNAPDTDEPDLFTVSIPGGTVGKMTDDHAINSWFAWAPDGNAIAYVAADPAHWPAHTLSVVSLDGHIDVLVSNSYSVDSVAWSPEGSSIAYASRPRRHRHGISNRHLHDQRQWRRSSPDHWGCSRCME